MKRKLLTTIVFALFVSTTFAQRVPDWVTNKPIPTNDTYLYVIESASGYSELSARNQAMARLFQSTALRLGQPINSEEINRAVQSGTSFEVISRNYNIPINKVCEYTENKSGVYRVYILCQVAKAGNIPVQFDDFTACYEGVNKYYAAEALSADGFNVYKNKRKLEDSEVRALFANSKSGDLYDIGMDYSVINRGWLASGAGIAACGLIWWVAGNASDPEYDSGTASLKPIGIGMTLAGSAIVIGIYALRAYGKKQIRKAVRLYNNGKMYSQNGLDMEYGFTGAGAYLTLSF